MSGFMVTYTNRDRQGNTGMIETLGFADELDEAKALAEAGVHRFGPAAGPLHWRDFSPRTWGLMSGQLYTYVLVSKCAEPVAEPIAETAP